MQNAYYSISRSIFSSMLFIMNARSDMPDSLAAFSYFSFSSSFNLIDIDESFFRYSFVALAWASVYVLPKYITSHYKYTTRRI